MNPPVTFFMKPHILQNTECIRSHAKNNALIFP